jgi:hypothetical protein
MNFVVFDPFRSYCASRLWFSSRSGTRAFVFTTNPLLIVALVLPRRQTMVIAVLGHFRMIRATLTYTEEEVGEGLSVRPWVLVLV